MFKLQITLLFYFLKKKPLIIWTGQSLFVEGQAEARVAYKMK
jgi:hypothetical protein